MDGGRARRTATESAGAVGRFRVSGLVPRSRNRTTVFVVTEERWRGPSRSAGSLAPTSRPVRKCGVFGAATFVYLDVRVYRTLAQIGIKVVTPDQSW